MKPSLPLVVSLALLPLTAAAADPAAEARAERPGLVQQFPEAFAPVTDDAKLPRVLLIGDSISIGYTPFVREALRGVANVHRIPDNGGPTTRGLALLDEWLGDGKWDAIHFNFGLHDIARVNAGQRRLAPADYFANLRKIVARLKATGAKLILATTTPVPDAGGGAVGFTYNHQPYLAYWHGKIYLQYLSALTQEHEPPTNTSIATSVDGYHWSPPRVVFPEYRLPAFESEGVSYPAGMQAVMHQRMGFYVAPDGRLLTLAFYGYCPTPQNSPNAGNGLGRVVREIHADGSLGPIYFIRYNRHAGWNETNTSYPFYQTSPDAGFVAACDAIMADKLYSLQWWEEDRGKDGFYAITPDAVAGAAEFNAKVVTSAGAGKAFDWFTRADGVIVGLWKNQYSALTTDRGLTWTPIVKNTTLRTTGAKTWGQRTDDGRYVIVHNHSATMANRWPVTALVGADGHSFDQLMVLDGEVPPRRFRGQFKETGQNYFRGITEGNGHPPGSKLWIAYSMNKEDIWVTQARVPLESKETAPLHEDFESPDPLARWNLHLPQWAPTRVVTEDGTKNHVLELRDEEPYDYALAERIFPANPSVHVAFRVQLRQATLGGTFEIEVQSQHHDRPMRLRLNHSYLAFDRGPHANPQVPITALRWYAIALDFDCEKQTYTLSVDGRVVQKDIAFAEKMTAPERIVFRTGPWRGQPRPDEVDGKFDTPGGLNHEDLPGADQRAAANVFWVDDLTKS